MASVTPRQGTGGTHAWDTAEHPLAMQCSRCHVPLVNGDSSAIDWRNGDVLAKLWIREDCPRG